MRDLFRFVWRGAVGGAIVPILVWTYLIGVLGAQLLWYFLISLIFLAIPGAIVGAVLWICALFLERLGFVVRVTIGIAVNAILLVLGWLMSSESLFYEPVNFRRFVFASTYYLLISGMAGWLCPEAAIHRREPEPPYRERVRQYEAAQAEHELKRTKRLKEGQEHKHYIHVGGNT